MIINKDLVFAAGGYTFRNFISLTEEEKIEYDRLTENAVQLEFDFEEMRKKPAINGEIWISCIEEVSDGISRED